MGFAQSVLPSPPRTVGNYIPALDGIRGVAICLVMLFHFTIYGGGGLRSPIFLDRLFRIVASAGWCGVDLFFVLSGFLITGILLDTKGSPHFFRNFYVRRVLRIFPLYYGFLVLMFVVLPRLFAFNTDLQSLGRNQVWYWTYLSNFLYIRGWAHASVFLSHFWSLAVEEQFYLFWPFLVFLLPRRLLQIVCMVCILGAPLVRAGLWSAGYPTAAYVLTAARCDVLAVGALLALMAHGRNGLSRASQVAFPCAAGSALTLGVIFVARRGLDIEDPVVQILGYSLLACLFGSILVMGITGRPNKIVGRFFSHRALRFFGRYSYAMYIFHQPIIPVLKQNVFSVGSLPRLLRSELPGQGLFLIVAVTATVCLALLSWHMLEKPCLKLKNFFSYQPRTQVSAPGSADVTDLGSKEPASQEVDMAG